MKKIYIKGMITCKFKKNEEDYESFEISPVLLKMKNYLQTLKILYNKADHKMLSGDLNNRNIYYKVAILNHKPLDSTVPVLFSSNDFKQIIIDLIYV